jgi:hypothetical protein
MFVHKKSKKKGPIYFLLIKVIIYVYTRTY